MSARTGDLLCVSVGAVYVLLGVWAAATPQLFASALADFGTYDQHLVRDFAAASTTIGLGLLVAARRPAWRVPLVALAATWSALHAVSHLISIADADPRVLGPVEAMALVLVTTALLVHLAHVRRTQEDLS